MNSKVMENKEGYYTIKKGRKEQLTHFTVESCEEVNRELLLELKHKDKFYSVVVKDGEMGGYKAFDKALGRQLHSTRSILVKNNMFEQTFFNGNRKDLIEFKKLLDQKF